MNGASNYFFQNDICVLLNGEQHSIKAGIQSSERIVVREENGQYCKEGVRFSYTLPNGECQKYIVDSVEYNGMGKFYTLSVKRDI